MSQEEKTDLILNLLSEILAEAKMPGNTIHDVIAKLGKIAESIGSDFTEIYDRSIIISKKQA